MGKITYPRKPEESFFKTDKIFYHGYFPEYVKIAAELGPDARVCEIGVYGGESLRMFQSLFPLGTVLGVDIDRAARWPDGTLGIISAQDDPQLPEIISEMHGISLFDLIVEDASHDGKLSRKTFEIMWPQVNPGGFYVLEDWFIGLPVSAAIRGYSVPSMLTTAESFLSLLAWDSDCESVHYRYGMAILRKKA